MKTQMIMNALGRMVPKKINGIPQTPFMGVGKYKTSGLKASQPIRNCSEYPMDGNKVVSSLKEALVMAGIRDGMTISSHHHFRNGDLVMNQVFDQLYELGIKNLRWFPSAAFPCHSPIIKHLENGTIDLVEGSLNGDLGRFVSSGKMKKIGVLRSHGGRWQAVQDGEVHIDIAIVAAPSADAFGNATGEHGPSACGSLGFALVDSIYATQVIVVTDNLVPFPCIPWQIQGQNVDHVVVMDKIGIPEKIVSGTTAITLSKERLEIAEMAAKFVKAAGIIKNGFSFQAGAGGIPLAFSKYVREIMKNSRVKARFIRGGSTKQLVKMLEEGITEYILDGQTFDLDGVRSLRENHGHISTSPFTSYNWHGKGNIASQVDVVVLGATEVDVNFNANVVTHSDGLLLHGIGGWQNCLFSKCTILAIPSIRKKNPIIVDELTTLVGPGELIDVIVTERGIAINPLRKDLLVATENCDLPIRKIKEIKQDIDKIINFPVEKSVHSNELVSIVKWVDGTVIDSIFSIPS